MSTSAKDQEGPEVVPVQVALCRIIAGMPPIGKDLTMGTGQYGFAYRGIEQITQVVQPLLAKHGVVIIPRSTLITLSPALDAKPGWQDAVIRAEWLIIGPDGSTLEASTIGIGRDNSDRAGTKAMTQAYKYLLLQLLAVSDSKDDGDGHENTSINDAEPEPTAIEILYEQVKATAGTEIGKGLKALAEASDKKLSAKALADDPDWADVVRIYITSTEGATNG